MKFLFLVCACILLSHQVTAAATPQIILTANTIHAEKISTFVLSELSGKFKIEMTSNFGAKREGQLTAQDVDFIKSEFAKLPVPPQIPNECSRFKISITLLEKKSVSKSSCFGLKTITEPAYGRFSKILVNAL